MARSPRFGPRKNSSLLKSYIASASDSLDQVPLRARRMHHRSLRLATQRRCDLDWADRPGSRLEPSGSVTAIGGLSSADIEKHKGSRRSFMLGHRVLAQSCLKTGEKGGRIPCRIFIAKVFLYSAGLPVQTQVEPRYSRHDADQPDAHNAAGPPSELAWPAKAAGRNACRGRNVGRRGFVGRGGTTGRGRL